MLHLVNQPSSEEMAKRRGYDLHERHIFLCAAKGPCTQGKDVEELWSFLKQRLSELEPDPSTAKVARTKSGCLRICVQGPIALVYPEGTLYGNLTKEKLDKIIIEHLLKGNVVEEYAIHSRPLEGPPNC